MQKKSICHVEPQGETSTTFCHVEPQGETSTPCGMDASLNAQHDERVTQCDEMFVQHDKSVAQHDERVAWHDKLKNIFDFESKRYVITGASSGIGGFIALSLNALGAEILAIGRDGKKLESKKNLAKYKDKFIPIIKDISQYEGLDKFSLELAKKYGSASGALLSAGVQQIAPMTSALSVENGKSVFDINYFGNLQILKGLLDKRAKTDSGASFVWISSNASVKAQKGLTNYAASKSAINAAIRTIALEIAPKYRINAISPGFTKTEMIEAWSAVYDKEYIESMDKAYPLGIGSVEDIAPLVLFLLSEGARWITGQNLVIDGGGSL